MSEFVRQLKTAEERIAVLKKENANLRCLKKFHYETIEVAVRKVESLRDRIKEVKIGNIKIPPFDDTNILTGEKLDLTLKLAYHMGAETGIILCGEILSKGETE